MWEQVQWAAWWILRWEMEVLGYLILGGTLIWLGGSLLGPLARRVRQWLP